jgi:VanZ family protein
MLPSLLSAPGRLPRFLRLALLAVAVGVLLWLSLAPNEDIPGADLIWDKASHAIAYAVLTVVGLLLFPRHPWAFLVCAVGLGGAVEVLQAAMGFGRQGDLRDLLADAIGIAVVAGVWRLMGGRRA